MKWFSASVILFLNINCILGDTPANCTYEELRGVWHLEESERGQRVDCNEPGPVVNTVTVKLLFPDIAVDEHGNKGRWTLIYNQGFEVTVNYRKFFAFSAFKQKDKNVTSFCDRTMPGWSHDIFGHNWACFVGRKAIDVKPKSYIVNHDQKDALKVYRNNDQLIKKINSKQSSWVAKRYEMFEGMSYEEINMLKGGSKSRIVGPLPSKTRPSRRIKHIAAQLPDEFDWRNVSGVNYVSPVRNQRACGSCYAFAAAGMLESRIRILTNNSDQVIISTQDVVDCSKYSQGCQGGFPYLIGKYGQDFGLINEECNPYKGQEKPCNDKYRFEPECKPRYYVADYSYIGDFYGGCNEELMKIELVNHGPIAVSFMVYTDFMYYDGGIYHHTGLEFNPFDITSHVVVVVGYGKDPDTQEKYWIVKNSWGKYFGEDGYFRIKRGNNECAIESLAATATLIPNN